MARTTRNAIVAFVGAAVLSFVALGLLAWGHHQRRDLRFRPAFGIEQPDGRGHARPFPAGPRRFPHADGMLPNGKPFPGRLPGATDRPAPGRPDGGRGPNRPDRTTRPTTKPTTTTTTTTTAPAGN